MGASTTVEERSASGRFYRSIAWQDLRKAALRRDRWRCQAEGCGERATHVDHIERRPHVDRVTDADVLSNLRCLCAYHDNQVKELARGGRARGGQFSIRGSDRDGWPLDPARR